MFEAGEVPVALKPETPEDVPMSEDVPVALKPEEVPVPSSAEEVQVPSSAEEVQVALKPEEVPVPSRRRRRRRQGIDDDKQDVRVCVCVQHQFVGIVNMRQPCDSLCLVSFICDVSRNIAFCL